MAKVLTINKQCGKTFDDLPILEAFLEIDKWQDGDLFTNNPIIIQYVLKNKIGCKFIFEEKEVTDNMNTVFSFYAKILKELTFNLITN